MTITNFTPTIDAPMEGISGPDVNYGGGTYGGARVVYLSGEKSHLFRSLGNFDVSSLSAYTISAASLWLYHYTTSGTPSVDISRNTRPATWTELGVTWNKYDGTNLWTAAGGDIDDTTPTKVTFSLGSSGWQEVTGLAGHVTDAISNRSNVVALNLHLVDEDPAVMAGHFWRAKEYGSLIWYLAITHDGPEPETEQLLLGGQVI